MDAILKILEMEGLTQEQKAALLGAIADDKVKENENNFDKKRQELIEKNRAEAEENRKRVEQYKWDDNIKYKSDILELLKHPTKDYYLFSRAELDSMTGYEIESNYEEYVKNYPETIKKAEKEYIKRKKDKENTENSAREDKKGLRKPPENFGTRKPKPHNDHSNSEDDENEIIAEEDCKELTTKERFKEIAKKVLKAGGIVGGIALAGAMIYNSIVQGDTSQISDAMGNAHDTISNGIQNAHDAISDFVQNVRDGVSNSDNVGVVERIYDTNKDAFLGTNWESPHPEYFQNNVLGYVTGDNTMIPCNTLDEVAEAFNNGVDVTSLYVGDENGIDGFVNTINGKPITEVFKPMIEESLKGRVK